MDRLIAWLSERKLFTILFTCIYLAVVILFHKEVSEISDWLSARLSFKVYNDRIFLISLMGLVVLLVFVLIRMRKGEHRFQKMIYWVFTTLLVVISYRALIVFNVEIIHFPQYAVLALPVFALLGRFGETVFWITLSGALDEAFQYGFLHPETFLDFNDIVLNLIGAGIGVVLIYTLLPPKFESLPFHGNPSRKWNQYLIFGITTWILFGGISLYASGILRFYPEGKDSKTLIILSNQRRPTQFWINLSRGKSYHQLHPIEGIFFSALLIACYSLMDDGLKTRQDQSNDGA